MPLEPYTWRSWQWLGCKKEITLNNHDREDKIETEIGDSDFMNIISLIVKDGEDDIDDREHEKTVIEIEDFLKIEPCFPSLLDWFIY